LVGKRSKKKQDARNKAQDKNQGSRHKDQETSCISELKPCAFLEALENFWHVGRQGLFLHSVLKAEKRLFVPIFQIS